MPNHIGRGDYVQSLLEEGVLTNEEVSDVREYGTSLDAVFLLYDIKLRRKQKAKENMIRGIIVSREEQRSRVWA